jgi:cephalosporin hydroxylase
MVLYKLVISNKIPVIHTGNIHTQISYLRSIPAHQFKDVTYLQSDLILRLGLSEYMPSLALNHYAYRGGLQLMQVPEQLAEYIALLSTQSIKSYLEIGVNAGGTFILVCEMLQKTNPDFQYAMGIDVCRVPNVSLYCRNNEKLHFEVLASQSKMFSNYVQKHFSSQFDLVFIDGDHDYHAVKSDFKLALQWSPKIIVFHDIVDHLCKDVVQLWREIKADLPVGYTYKEITTQSPSSTYQVAGIGLLLKAK